MALGFFKKSVKADLILHNGVILTQGPDSPVASAVACSQDKIIAVGDFESMDSLVDSNTQIIDLNQQYVLPGLIDLLGSPVTDALKDNYLDLTQCSSSEQLCSMVSQWDMKNQEAEIVFGYGYNEDVFERETANAGEDAPKIVMEILDGVCDSKPVVLLCKSTVSCLLNSAAAAIVKETADEEMVQFITVPYILNLLVPFDFEQITQKVDDSIKASLSSGFTSVVSLGSPDYFESIYQDALISLYNEDSLDQKFFGSYMMNRPLFPKGLVHRLMERKTMCNEIDGLINATTLYVDLNQSQSPVGFSQNSTDEILAAVADKGFGIYIKAADEADFNMAVQGLEYIRGKGYKDTFTIESNFNPEKLSSELMYSESAYYMPPLKDLCNLPIEDFIQTITVTAASIIDSENSIGSIEVDKFADMAVFSVDPMGLTPEELLAHSPNMTISNGKII